MTAALVTVPWLLVRPAFAASLAAISLPGLPAFGEAFARAAAGLTGALLVGAAACAAGAVVLRRLGWQTTSRIEQLVFAWTIGVGVVAYGSLLLAALRIYRPLAVGVFVAVLLLTSRANQTAPDSAAVGLKDRRLPERQAIAWLVLVAAALGFGLIAALAPEKEFDALWYHLYLPRLWLETGHPVDLVEEYVSLYPLTWELVFGAGMTLGGVIAAKLLHFTCLPLLALLVWRAARSATGQSAPAAAAFVVTTPTLLWESSTAYIDLALALHVAAGAYALAQYVERNERPWGLVAALQLGLAAATKHLGIITAIIALAVFAGAALRRGRRPAAVMRAVALLALIAALVPSPWYLRSWLASGNPVFPEMYSLFGAAPPGRWDARATDSLKRFTDHFGRGRTAGALALLPWDVSVHGAAFAGSLGPMFLLLLPALLMRRSARSVGWLAAGIVAYGAVWASPVASLQLRFLMPIVPPLALLAAAALDHVRTVASRVGKLAGMVGAAVVTLTALNLPPFVRLHEVDREHWDGWLTHVLRAAPVAVVVGRESEASYLRRQVPSFAAWQAIDARLPADARVLTFSEGDQLYSHRKRVPHHAPMARGAVWDAGEGQTASAIDVLRRLGITHVLFDRRELTPQRGGSSLALASAGFQEACVPEFDDGRYWLCRLEYDLPPLVPRR